MPKQSEYKKKFNPELGKFTRQHIWREENIEGGSIADVFKSFGKTIFGKTMKKAAKKGFEKAVTSAATKTGEYAGKKAGDKIVQMLSKGRVPPTPKKPTTTTTKKVTFKTNPKKLTQQNINKRVNAILSGGKII